MCFQISKEKPQDLNMSPVGLAIYAQKFPRTLHEGLVDQKHHGHSTKRYFSLKAFLSMSGSYSRSGWMKSGVILLYSKSLGCVLRVSSKAI